MKLSKAVIKKYGITKKAWSVQRGMSSSSRTSKRNKPKKYKTRSVYKVAKKKTSRRRASSMFGALNTPIMGAAGVVAYESFISPMIPVQGVAKDLLELAGGLYLSRRKGILGATGKALVTINSYQLIRGFVGDKLTGLMGSNEAIANTYQGAY